MHATLKQYRQSPQKVRLLANLVRGKRVDEALATLSFTTKRAAEPLAKLVRSAVANAKQANAHIREQDLRIGTITVDDGVTLHRAMPRARGRATPINKRTSHVSLTLTPITEKNAEAAPVETESAADSASK